MFNNNNYNQEGSSSNNHGNGVSVAVPESLVMGPTKPALVYNPGLSLQWTPQEQSLLEDLLIQYASDCISMRYGKIAIELEKSIRDVAFRCSWMRKQETAKRRNEDNSSSRKGKGKMVEDGNPSSGTALHVTDRAYTPPYAETANQMDNDDDDNSYKVLVGRELMAASADGSNTNNNQEGSISNNHGNGVSWDGFDPAQDVLWRNPGKRIALEWTSQEQSVLKDLLTNKNASVNISQHYAKIAMNLEGKNVRDVAFYCRWMTKKENGKRRNEEDISSSRTKKDKKGEDGNPSSSTSMHVTDRAYAPPYAQTVIQIDSDDDSSYEDIGVKLDDLIKENAEVLNQISDKFLVFKIHDNHELFRQAKNNFTAILNDLKEMPEVKDRMPPLPVKLDEELINSVIPPTP